MKRVIVGASLGLLALGAWVVAGDDDLAVVKRAVAVSQAVPTAPEAATPAVKATKASRRTEPQWLKVRVIEKANQKAKVTINLPLALAHLLGDEVPLDWHCGSHHRCVDAVKLSEVLATLEGGQSLVEIDDDEATVRIWVE